MKRRTHLQALLGNSFAEYSDFTESTQPPLCCAVSQPVRAGTVTTAGGCGARRGPGCLLQVETLKHLTARFPGTQSAFLSAASLLAGGRQPETPPHSPAYCSRASRPCSYHHCGLRAGNAKMRNAVAKTLSMKIFKLRTFNINL